MPIPSKKKLLQDALSDIREGMSSKVYMDAQRRIDVAERYRLGDQIPDGYKGDPRLFTFSLAAVESDLQRLAGMVAGGTRETVFHPQYGWASDLEQIMAAQFESWENYEAFGRKLTQCTYKQFDQGASLLKFYVDPLTRVGDDLPRIGMDVIDMRQVVVDPRANNPLDPQGGARWIAIWEPTTLTELIERFDGREYRRDIQMAQKVAESQEPDSWQVTTGMIDELHPLRVYLRNMVTARTDLWPDFDTTNKATEDSMLAGIDFYHRITVRDEETGKKRRTWMRMYIVTDLEKGRLVKSIKRGILMDARILNYEGRCPAMLMTAMPPYGRPVVDLAKSAINQRNFTASATAGIIAEMVRQSRKFGMLKEVWDDKQRVAYETHHKSPDTYLFSADKLMHYTGSADVRSAIQSLTTNFPNLSELIGWENKMKENQDELMSSPWTATGQANPSSRLSGAAINLMQTGVRMTKSIIADMVQYTATEAGRVAWAMMRENWTGPHRIFNEGITSKRMNEIVVDPGLANTALNENLDIEGEPVRVTGVQGRFLDSEGKPFWKVYPISDDVTDVRQDPTVKMLAQSEGITSIVWLVNGMSTMKTELVILVKVDSIEEDQDNMARFQLLDQSDPTILAPENKYRMVLGSKPTISWDDNLRMKAQNEKMELLGNLTDEELEPIIAQAQQIVAQQAAAAPSGSNAPAQIAAAT